MNRVVSEDAADLPSDLGVIPRRGIVVPDMIAALPGGDEAVAVWKNGFGGVAFRLPAANGHPPRHAKWQRGGADLAGEAERLR